MGQPKQHALLVLTVGHSTRPIDKFIELLKAHGVQRVVDVRTVPKSRRNPQFGQDVHKLTPFARVSGNAITYPALL